MTSFPTRSQAIGIALAEGLAKHREADWPAALAAYDRALALDPDHAPTLINKGAALRQMGQPGRALPLYWRVIALAPDSREVWINAANALADLDRRDEAASAIRTAIERLPNAPETWITAARLCRSREMAAALLQRAEALGGIPEKALEARPVSSRVELHGGERILLLADGSLATAIRAIRCVPLLTAQGARVELAAPGAWHGVLGRVEGIAACHASARDSGKVDLTLSLNQLEDALGVSEMAEPKLARLVAPAPAKLDASLGTRLKVGLLWAAEDRRAAIPFEKLLMLTGLPDIRFFSLQTGAAAAQAARRQVDPALIADLSPGLRTLSDLAAAIAGLDLVICADGAMPYLAAGMGIPTWLVSTGPEPDWWSNEDRRRHWYPEVQLFRNAGDWNATIAGLRNALSQAAARDLPEGEQADLTAFSVFPNLDGKPRFQMTAPRRFLSDPGIRYLMVRERKGIGYEYATRSFLDAHLQPGDLFVDVGAHWGIMSLQAATRRPGQIRVLAIEPSPVNLPHLSDWLAMNGVTEQVEIVHAFAADRPGKGKLKPQSTMGHSLIRQEDGRIPVVTVDSLLAQRRDLAACKRVIVKIDVEGSEPEVIAGMDGLLKSGRVAAVIWERGREYDSEAGQARLAALRRHFASMGFTAFRFESEDRPGPLVPFEEDGRLGNVFELNQGLVRADLYGVPRLPQTIQTEDAAFDAAIGARDLFARGTDLHKQGKTADAREHYRKALALDGTLSGPWNNLGAVLRDQGNRHAAAAAYRRALAYAPDDTGVMSNLGNALRESGEFTEAEAILHRALALQPGNPGLLYNLGVLCKDTDRPVTAIRLFEHALLLAPEDPEYRWDRALALLQSGDYRQGFEAYESRWGLKRAAKRKIGLPVWGGEDLAGRSLFLSDEQGFGDVLQWSRFIPVLKAMGAGSITLECQPELMRLMAQQPDIDAVVARGAATPDCDLTVPLLSLPRLFGTTLENLPTATPYLIAPESSIALARNGKFRLGLVWAGKPTPRDRSVSLEMLFPMLADPKIAAYSLQVGPRATDLKRLEADFLIKDLAPQLGDFAETAAVLKQLDLLVTVDTAVCHLAGALGVPTFLMLRRVSDWRWFDRREDSPWYPSMRLFRQRELDRWEDVIEAVAEAVANQVREVRRPSS